MQEGWSKPSAPARLLGTSTINDKSWANSNPNQTGNVSLWIDQVLSRIPGPKTCKLTTESDVKRGLEWQTLFEYCKKSESFQVPTEAQIAHGAHYNASYHGGLQGPLKVGWATSMTNSSVFPVLEQPFEKLGVQYNPDSEGGKMVGLTVRPDTLDRTRNVHEDAAEGSMVNPEPNPESKVYATQNLRVVDASVLSFQLCGHLTSMLSVNHYQTRHFDAAGNIAPEHQLPPACVGAVCLASSLFWFDRTGNVDSAHCWRRRCSGISGSAGRVKYVAWVPGRAFCDVSLSAVEIREEIAVDESIRET
ncbi:uncharacterized protein BP01DRAFT_385841 [Aspergillus saccharolyticus JOP 1030-1]|uniref:Glucose-methanol-choline oxidoreductase C-terminal domain-containing protein n=1 Tax=Aspergillus saccharolyticus JOP 1030-1 TaxID=1450539 RepID=A0A318Z4L5_9EURO|nr:hypothetical protein BP01DRAFT_385841 [Aspergillus saccharolyticus JOP 1030-1]PYH41989.1 hypothetical protein BP01DRAFT_385841 [Aspergillus saccharolyticus JOP 1030-1]